MEVPAQGLDIVLDVKLLPVNPSGQHSASRVEGYFLIQTGLESHLWFPGPVFQKLLLVCASKSSVWMNCLAEASGEVSFYLKGPQVTAV